MTIKQKQLGGITELDKDGYGVVNAHGSRITNVGAPINENDVATKGYVITAIESSGGAPVGLPDTVLLSDGNINFWSKITDAYIDNNANIDIHKLSTGSDGYVLQINNGIPEWKEFTTGAIYHHDLLGLDADDHPQYLLINGGRELTGNQSAGDNKIIQLAAPSDPTDAATKSYADTKLSLLGGTMGGDINMNGHAINGLADPVDIGDGVNKNYIDNLYGFLLGNYIYTVLFGDGLDENNQINNLTLTAGQTFVQDRQYYYDTVSITGAGAYFDVGPFELKAKTINLSGADIGAIRRSGNNGGNSSGTSAGAAGAAITDGGIGGAGAGTAGIAGTTGNGGNSTAVAALNPASGGSGGSGGVGGTGNTTTGGSGGSVANLVSVYNHSLPLIPTRGTTLIKGGSGGSGGGAGGGDSSAAKLGGGGGGGGSGAPYLLITCENLIIDSNTSSQAILCKGGDGGNGGNSQTGGITGGGSGAGGGGGGRIDLRILNITGPTVNNLISAPGGDGGDGGNGNIGMNGTGGSGGNGGTISYCNLKTGEIIWVFGTLGAANSGSVGGAGGSCYLTLP
jgi:hypothetical protein